MKTPSLIMLVATVAGCTTKDIYSNLQYNHARSCDRLKSTQSDDCRSQYNDSFEDYTQKREGTLAK
ncbi:hypothetical protein [Marinomonas primoryensis]|uniref:hypothetical protein n=1 Tax=Marinomonas primoryensis TaxID=178399 RepID=UPI0013AF15F8|nr:hypothetical protein [Marinomonas primoryensis]